MSPHRQSDIWNYFKLNEHDPEKADCIICNKTYSRKGRTTTPLKNHLKSMHKEVYCSFESSSKEKQLQKIKNETEPKDQSATQLAAKIQLSAKEVDNEEKTFNTNNYNLPNIDKLIGEMIALQNLPFSFVEGLGFRRLIQKLAPQYNLKGCDFFSDFLCTEQYGKVAEKVKVLIEQFDYISLTFDIWTDLSSNVSLLSLTCHGIDENFDRSSVLLKCETFEDHHTDYKISDILNTMLSEWDIGKEHVHCFIRDEECNMMGAVQLGELNEADCIVHKMQLAIRSCLDSQENIKIVKQKCKKISTHFNRSIIAQKQLQAIQDMLNQPHLNVFHDSITRWNRTFYMLKRFLKVKDALSVYTNDSEINPILPEEWKIIESCIELLEPFEKATRELSSSCALISFVIPTIQVLKKHLDEYLTSQQDFDLIRQAVMSLKSELSLIYSNLVTNNLYVIATYLDPRFKQKFLSPVTEKMVKEDITMMIKRYTENDGTFRFEGAKRMRITNSSEDTELLEPGISGLVKKPCSTYIKNYLATVLDSSSEDEGQEKYDNGSLEAVIKKQLFVYRFKKRINVDENPLKWWSVHREQFSLLSPIARRFLSAPPASVPSEQLFSSTGLICEPLRNMLDPEKTEKLLFIRNNAPIFNFNY